MSVSAATNASPARFIAWATLTLTVFLLFVHEKVSAQEKRKISHPGTLAVPLSPKAVTQRAIAQTFMSVNRADTIQGGSFQLYILEDTFRLRIAYDGNHLVEIDDDEPERVQITDLRNIRMTLQTTMETILFQRINFTDTLTIDALKTPAGSVTTTFAATDSLPAAKRRTGINDLTGKSIYEWKLAQVGGDTLSFMTLKGKKSVIVFNSVGWKPCMQVLPILARLATTPGVTVVSIEPFVTNRDALKKHRETHAIGYPIVMTNRTLKKTYPGVQVPTFLLADTGGIVREVIVGHTRLATEAAIQQALQRLH
jgi:hypothetical protein